MNKRGMSLMEVAIVLGVVGMVIGGVWVAAATVQENARIKQASEGMIMMYQQATTILNYGNIPAAYAFIADPAIIKMGIAPANWVKDSNNVVDPWGNGVYFAVNGSKFQISLFNLPQDRCIRLINSVATFNADANITARALYSVNNVGVPSSIGVFPVSPTSNFCQATNSEIAFLFNFTRVN